MAGLEGLLIGRTLATRYSVGDVVGRGGMGAVFKAEDLILRRTVALKVVTVSGGDEEDRQRARGRFEREAQALARLQHRNIVTVYDFGTDTELGIDFLVMELLRGEDLASRLRTGGRVSRGEALQFITEAADGVAAGHRAGLIHRDIKPGNLFLTEDSGHEPGRVVILDFGIARMTSGGEQLTSLTRGHSPLSPAYASPEQVLGKPAVSAASDVYSLAAVGYELLTGSRVHVDAGDRGDAPTAAAIRLRDPSIPPGIAGVIDRALSRDPSGRYADGADFSAAWRHALTEAGDEAFRNPSIVPASAPALPRILTPPSPPEENPDPPRIPPARLVSRAGSEAPRNDSETVTTLYPAKARREPKKESRRAPAAFWGAALVALLLVVGVWAMRRGGSDNSDPAAIAADDESAAEDAGSQPAAGTDTASVGGLDLGSDAPPSTSGARAAAASGEGVSPAPPSPAGATPAGGNAVTLNAEGLRLFNSGQAQQAVDRFRAAVQLAPNNVHFRNNLGWALYEAGDLNAAVTELDRVISMDPRRDIAYANMGEARLALGDTAAAISAYQQFLQLNTDPSREEIAAAKLRRIGGRP